MTIAAKLLIAAEACGYVQKDGNNAFHKYRYASAANILGHVNDALTKAGLAVVETLPEIVSETGTGKDRVVTARMTLTVGDTETTERATFRGLGSGMDSGDKAVMKAITAATKYAWMGAFSISTGDDPEADESTDRRASKPAPKAPPSASPINALGIERPQSHVASRAREPGDDDEVAQPAPDAYPQITDATTGLTWTAAVARIELPGEAVAVWMRWRAALATLAPPAREACWKALCKRTEEVGQMKNAKVWLKKAIAEEDARRAAAEGQGGDHAVA